MMSGSDGLQVGQQLLVEVECVFDEGLVVSYSDGFVARGAMLFVPPAHSTSLGGDLVNGNGTNRNSCGELLYMVKRNSFLFFVSEALTVNIPNCLLSDWKPSSRNLLAIGERKKQLVMEMLNPDKKKGRFSKWHTNERRQPLVVKTTAGSGRLSKILASEKIKECQRFPRNRLKLPIRRCRGKPKKVKNVSCQLDMSVPCKGLDGSVGNRVRALKRCSVEVTKLRVQKPANEMVERSSSESDCLAERDEQESSSEDYEELSEDESDMLSSELMYNTPSSETCSDSSSCQSAAVHESLGILCIKAGVTTPSVFPELHYPLENFTQSHISRSFPQTSKSSSLLKYAPPQTLHQANSTLSQICPPPHQAANIRLKSLRATPSCFSFSSARANKASQIHSPKRLANSSSKAGKAVSQSSASSLKVRTAMSNTSSEKASNCVDNASLYTRTKPFDLADNILNSARSQYQTKHDSLTLLWANYLSREADSSNCQPLSNSGLSDGVAVPECHGNHSYSRSSFPTPQDVCIYISSDSD